MKPPLQFATSPSKSPLASFTFFFFFLAPIPPPTAIDNPQSTFCLYIFFYARHFINGIIHHMVFCDWLISLFIFFNLFIWLFLVVPCKIFDLHCSTWTLGCSLWDIVPWPGTEPRSPVLGPPGKSLGFFHLTFSRFNHIVADISTLFPLMME